MKGGLRLKREVVQLEALSFRPQRMVKWLSPPQLARSASELVVSGLFGKFSDKRELQTWDQPVYQHANADELWIDYASDVGDGFDSTYSVAWLLARDALPGNNTQLPRGSVLVLGGDEVYPSASRLAYEDHFIGPYTAALPHFEPEDEAPWLYAVPGNHDWYDGLTSFLRLFCQGRWIGGWRTKQKRSYFAMQLPPPWWLWAVDIQLDTEVDELQLNYFSEAAKKMKSGDRLLLLTAKPSWVSSAYEPASYRNLAYIERKLVPPEVELVATLTGDLHHYSRYELTDEALATVPQRRITVGGGGAYLSGTHTLPPEIPLAREPWRPTPDQETDVYSRAAVYPECAVSRKLSWGALLAPLKTRSLAGLLAFLYVLLAAAALGAVDGREGRLAQVAHDDGWGQFLADSIGGSSVVLALLMAAALTGYADFRNLFSKPLAGLTHAVPHVALAVTAAWGVTRLFTGGAPDVWVWLAVLLGTAVAGAVAGSLLFGTYLFLVHRWRGAKVPHHTNEAFAGQALTGYKCFLRLHVQRDGPTTVYPLGLDEACDDWNIVERPDGRPTIVPAEGKQPHARLIEPPFQLGPS
jgi:hypothetical protein